MWLLMSPDNYYRLMHRWRWARQKCQRWLARQSPGCYSPTLLNHRRADAPRAVAARSGSPGQGNDHWVSHARKRPRWYTDGSPYGPPIGDLSARIP